ncbi:MAG: chemotaxis protein CheW [Rhodospirillales bacterium]|nr:chemotaxis protein CheW [Rhodospirillales bacterium]
MSDFQTELDESATREYVTATVRGQLCGIPVMKVQDVLGPQQITPIPLSVPEVAGSLNLRGRVVTAIDLRVRMGLDRRDEKDKGMSVVVEHRNELYSLMVDSVGEVLKMSDKGFERNPPTLDPLWRSYSEGIYRLEKGLLLILNVENLLDFGVGKEAA